MKLRYKILSGVGLVLVVAVAAGAWAISRNAPCTEAAPVATGAATMRAVIHRCYGASEVLELAVIDKPVPAADEVLVRVHAASVNPLDWHYMRGSPYIMRLDSGLRAPSEPRLGVDFAGTVEAVGRDVTNFAVGDAVFGGRTGAFSDYVVVREDRALARIPANVSFEEAAAVPIAALTALQALRDKGRLQAGEKVLINGASGGVGTFAVQIAKAMGAEVTGVSSTRNLDLVRSLGADHVVDYTREDYTQADTRYDLIVDLVGNHTLRANRRALVPGGRFVIVGAEKGNWFRPLANPLKALVYDPLVDEEFVMLLAELNADDLAYVAGLMETGAVTPVIDRRYRLDEVPVAIRRSESGRSRGKLIIEVTDRAGETP